MEIATDAMTLAIGFPFWDYLFVTSVASKFVSFDYRYWPLSQIRCFAIVTLAIGVSISLAIMHPPETDGRLWIIVPACLGLLAHGCLSVIDIFRQKSKADTENDDR
ncbi:MAG: hypothetical protein EBR34_12265 [Sphingomonadaceae bacterium]|nr:hypothetical protein [Sphingomonadaceae bacterium]